MFVCLCCACICLSVMFVCLCCPCVYLYAQLISYLITKRENFITISQLLLVWIILHTHYEYFRNLYSIYVICSKYFVFFSLAIPELKQQNHGRKAAKIVSFNDSDDEDNSVGVDNSESVASSSKPSLQRNESKVSLGSENSILLSSIDEWVSSCTLEC